MAQNEKYIDLVIRARDEYKKVIAGAEGALTRLQKAQLKVAARSGINELQAEYKLLTDRATRYAKAIVDVGAAERRTAAESRELRDTFALTRDRIRETKSALVAQRTELQRLKGATQGTFTAFSRNADAMLLNASATTASATASTANSASLNKMRTSADGAAASENRLRTAVQKANAQLSRQTGFAGRVTKAYASRQGRGPLGLRPYELTNLSYQINDVVSGIAMGQPIMQIFAQQAGQIIQIFPKAMTAIFRLVPAIAAVTAAVGPFVAAGLRMKEFTDSVQIFSRELSLSADSASYNAQNLAKITEELRRMGFGADEARKSISTFMKVGLDESRIKSFLIIAQKLGKVTGDDIPTASGKLAKAFSSGVDEVRKLDEQLNFLTGAQYEHIRAMEDAGNTTGALEEAQKILEDRLGGVSDKATGPWSSAWEKLGNAWNTYLNYLQNTLPMTLAIEALNKLGETVNWLTGLLPGSGPGTNNSTNAPGAYGADIRLMTNKELKSQIADIKSEIAATQIEMDVQVFAVSPTQQSILDQLKSEKKQLEKTLATPMSIRLLPPKVTQSSGSTSTPGTVPGASANSANPLNETEQARKKRLDTERKLNELLGVRNASLRESVQLGLLNQRDRYIQRNILQSENDARKLGLKLTEAQREQIHANAALAFDVAERERKRRKDANAAGGSGGKSPYEEAQVRLNDLLAYRKVLLEQIKVLKDAGRSSDALLLTNELENLNKGILVAVTGLEKMLGTMSGPKADAALLKLKALRRKMSDVGDAALVSGKSINESLAGVGVSAFGAMAEALANGKNAFVSFKDAFLKGMGDMLIKIGQMILKQALLNALQGGGGPNGGVGGYFSNAISALFKHTGGMADSGVRRSVPMHVFANAQRYHSGGLPGLKSGEVAAVLQTNEEVLTRQDPRHILNGGGGASSVQLKNVNVIDGSDLLEQALSTDRGEKVLFNFMSRNSRKIAGII